MNKEEFLNKLEKELSILNEKERQDILDEYKDTISEKVKHGQTEEEAVKDFGDLDELVSGILEAYKINPEYNQKETGFNKFTSESEKIIKKGANKLANMTKEFANNIKNNDTEMNLNLAFEIIIKIFCVLIIMALLTLPFKLFKSIAFAFAETFFSPVSALIKLIALILFVALYFGISLIIIISLFKQYFKKSNNNSFTSNEEEKTVNEKQENLEETPKKQVIIQKTGPTVGSVLLLFLKIWVVLFVLFPLFCADTACVLGLVISIFYWIKGINLLGLTLLLLGISSMFIWFTILIFNLTFSKGKTTIIPFFVGIIITIFGTLFFIDMITNIEFIDEAPKSYQIEAETKYFTADKEVYINYNLNGTLTKKIDETLKDNEFKLILNYDKESVNINIVNDLNYTFPSEECLYSVDKQKCETTYNYISLNYDYNNEYNIGKKKYQEFIENLKNNKIYDYTKLNEVNVEIIANENTLSLIETN